MSNPESDKVEETEESPVATVYQADSKVKALSSEIRRGIISLLFVKGPLYNAAIAKEIGIKPSHLAYHLGMLEEAGYVKKTLKEERDGKQFALYAITDAGEDFLDFIGAKPKLEQLITGKAVKASPKRDVATSPAHFRRVALYVTGDNTNSVVRNVEIAFRDEDIDVILLDESHHLPLQPSEMLKIGQEMRNVDAAIMMTLNVDRIDYLMRNKVAGTLMGYAAASDKPFLWFMRDTKQSKDETETLRRLHEEYRKLVFISLSNFFLKGDWSSWKTVVHETKAILQKSE